MLCHVDLWNPPPSQRDPADGINIDVWNNLADLFNVLKRIDKSYVKLYTQKREGRINMHVFYIQWSNFFCVCKFCIWCVNAHDHPKVIVLS